MAARVQRALPFLFWLTATLAAGAARAVDPFEIQVYEGDINDPLQPGLELHTNFVADGRSAPAFPGEAVPQHTLRTTLEPSLGLLKWWELGAYLQLASAPGRGEAHFGGFKLRSKFVVPRRATGRFTLGVNFEVGRGTAALGSAAWDSELRPIIAWERGRFFAAINPIIGWSWSDPGAPELEPCAKVRVDAGHHVGVGVEYYAGLGPVSKPAAWRHQEQFVYLAGDLLDGPIELNAGVGRGLTAASDDWIVKAIVGKTF
jgi:hypothetical protein